MISIDLYGDPVPQRRPKFFRRGSHVGVYDSQHNLKQGFKWQISSVFREEILKGPLEIWALFYMPIPKSTTKLKKRQMTNGLIGHTKKPDLDNLVKFIFDCMNGIVFQDDSQIIEFRCKKIYSDKPGINLRIFPRANDNKGMLYENCARDDGWRSLS